jgi:hypothetical protein
MAAKRTGGCTCGWVRYTLSGEPCKFGLCHCAKCRKESGSMFVAYAHWPRQDCDVTDNFATHEGRSFCPVCGSRLFDLNDSDIEIRVGSLDEAPTTLGSPAVEAWIKRRETWLRPLVDADQYSEDPSKTDGHRVRKKLLLAHSWRFWRPCCYAFARGTALNPCRFADSVSMLACAISR